MPPSRTLAATSSPESWRRIQHRCPTIAFPRARGTRCSTDDSSQPAGRGRGSRDRRRICARLPLIRTRLRSSDPLGSSHIARRCRFRNSDLGRLGPRRADRQPGLAANLESRSDLFSSAVEYYVAGRDENGSRIAAIFTRCDGSTMSRSLRRAVLREAKWRQSFTKAISPD
jgi:hypothetical protein